MLSLSISSTSKSIVSCISHPSNIPKLGSVKQADALLFRTSSARSVHFKSVLMKAIAGANSAVETDSQSSGLGSKRALISLSDKTDLALLGIGLQELGFTIVSTGGTASALENAGITVTKVEEITRFPEMVPLM